MSGSFPTSPAPATIKITSIYPTLVSVTHSLKRQARQRGGQRWTIEANYPPLSRSDFAPVWAFSNSQKGRYETFTFIPPVYSDTQGSLAGTVLVNNFGGYSAGASSIAIDGITSGTFKAGDFIKFSGHDKVYQVISDTTNLLSIEPALVENVANNEEITYNDVPFTVAFANDSQEMSVSVNNFVSYKISLVEVV